MGKKLAIGMFLIIIGLISGLGIYMVYKSDQTRKTNLRIFLQLFVPYTIKIESNTIWSGEIDAIFSSKDISGGSYAKYEILGPVCKVKIEKPTTSGDVHIKIYGWGIKDIEHWVPDGTKEGRLQGNNPLNTLLAIISYFNL